MMSRRQFLEESSMLQRGLCDLHMICGNSLMGVLFYGFALIFIALIIQFFVWRVHLPQNQTKALLAIFFGTFVIGVLVLWVFSSDIRFLGISAPVAIHEYLQLCFFFVSLTLGYIATYSALEVDSPSLMIVMAIAKEGEQGLDETKLRQKMNDDILLIPRVNDLISSKLAYLDGDVCKLTPKGTFVAAIFTTYRKLLKKAQKGG